MNSNYMKIYHDSVKTSEKHVLCCFIKEIENKINTLTETKLMIKTSNKHNN